MSTTSTTTPAATPSSARKAPSSEEGVAQVAADTLASIGSQVSMTAQAASELGRAVVKLTDQRVHQRPWQAALVAGSIGVLIGLMINRR